MNMPSLFVPHGAPDLTISQHQAARFLKCLNTNLPRPAGIVIISAHWETRGLKMTTAPSLETIYDFGGFSPDLYELKYPAKTSPALISMVDNALKEGDIVVDFDTQRGLDHGAWVPLILAYPDADIPIVQLSLDRTSNSAALYELGQALALLRAQGILIIGSGGAVHNLRHVAPEGTTVPTWASGFDGWLDQTLANQDLESLLAYSTAPYFNKAHPTPEHFLPIIVAAGAGDGNTPEKIHASYSYGSLSMSVWRFGG